MFCVIVSATMYYIMLPLSPPLYLHLSAPLSLRPSISLLLYLSAPLSLHTSISLPLYLSVPLSLRTSISLPLYLSAPLPLHPFNTPLIIQVSAVGRLMYSCPDSGLADYAPLSDSATLPSLGVRSRLCNQLEKTQRNHCCQRHDKTSSEDAKLSATQRQLFSVLNNYQVIR